jgi:hypothetical protein
VKAGFPPNADQSRADNSRYNDMKIIIKNLKENPVNIFRRAGYVFKNKGEDYLSFIRAFGKSGYPRFHIYAYPKEKETIIYLHLDQKKETYGKAKRHHGEYEDSPTLIREVERLKNILK